MQPLKKSGYSVQVHGEDMTSEVIPAPHPQGTTVEVRDLFFNTPARRKFLRAEKTELGRIDDVIRKMTLSHPAVAIMVTHNGKVYRQFQAASAIEINTIVLKRFLARVF